MVRIYTCEACERGDHAHCERWHPAPPGFFGGSRCVCPCEGDPDYMEKGLAAIRKRAADILKFEEQSRKGMEKDDTPVKRL